MDFRKLGNQLRGIYSARDHSKRQFSSLQQDFFKEVETIKERISQKLSKSDPKEIEFFKKSFEAIDSLTKEEKDYFMFKFYRESVFIDKREMEDGFIERMNLIPSHILSNTSAHNTSTPSSKEVVDSASSSEKKPEKNTVSIEVSSIDLAKKLSAIKEVKALLGIGLKEAKERVESCPFLLKEDISKEEAESLLPLLEKAGLKLTIK